MKNIGKHIFEYYQNGKYIGSHTFDGILRSDEVAYANRSYITDGVVQLKRKYKATPEQPIKVIKYNLQGR